jgi:hypothetical protein
LPSADARTASVNQDPPRPDAGPLAKFTRVIGLLRSDNDGERANAEAIGIRMLRDSWEDLVEACHRIELAEEAAKHLLAENNELRAENDQLRAGNSPSIAITEWADVSSIVDNPQRQARWCLDQHAAGKLYLNVFETEFLPNIASWRGSLSERQQPVFDRIIAAVARRCGRKPPS